MIVAPPLIAHPICRMTESVASISRLHLPGRYRLVDRVYKDPSQVEILSERILARIIFD